MRITIVGGGSYCWTPILLRDILFTPGLEGAEICLEDINKKHLADLMKCSRAIIKQAGKEKGFTLTGTPNEREGLKGADCVILTITTGGYGSMAHDLRIPYKYGIYQPVGDTCGPGGISRALRNIPVVVGIAKTMEQVCPNAWLLNITNPMTTLTRAVWRETDIRCIGLCHELYGTLRMLEKLLRVKNWRTDFDCVTVGVNHLPWITKLNVNGKDAFPALRRKLKRLGEQAGTQTAAKGKAGTALDHTLTGSNQVKFQLFEDFGCLPAAGDRHLVEFFPYFLGAGMRRGKEMGVKLTTIEDRRNKWMPAWKKNVRDLTAGRKQLDARVSTEATAKVIAALLGQRDWVDVLNLPNAGQIPELPKDAIVETMGLVRHDSACGLPVGDVPAEIMAQLQRFTTLNEMVVEAAVHGDRDLALRAMLLDPLCGSVRKYGDIEKMLDALLLANKQWLPQFKFPKGRKRK